MTIYLTKYLRVYDTDSGASVIVSEDGDGLGMVNVKAVCDYFGKIDFSMDADMAVALANALLEQAKYIKETENER